MSFDPNKYGSVISPLVNISTIPPLDEGSVDMFKRMQIAGTTLETLFMKWHILDFDMARGCLATIMMLNDLLDEALQITNAVKTPQNSYIGAICYRRKSDAANAEKNFSEAGKLPFFSTLVTLSKQFAKELPELQDETIWNTKLFSELCLKHKGKANQEEEACKKLQFAETKLLFDFCFNKAVDVTKNAGS